VSPKHETDLQEAQNRFRRFLAGETEERVFTHPIRHPAYPTGFCFCEGSILGIILFSIKATALRLALALPFNAPKVWLLRRLGAKVGRNVLISAGAYIDPNYPELLTIEDEVCIGIDAKILTHEFRIDEFRAGKVILRRGAVIGGFSIIACGVEIGEFATVAAGAVVRRDVPSAATAIGNPARIVKAHGEEAEAAQHDD
jgi:acetyltransferase-like isoleucine patch superfamily enzyme